MFLHNIFNIIFLYFLCVFFIDLSLSNKLSKPLQNVKLWKSKAFFPRIIIILIIFFILWICVFHVSLLFWSYSLFYEFVFLTEGKGRILYTPYKLPIYIARKKLIIKVHLCTWWSSKLKFKVAPGSFIRSNIFFVIFLRAPKNSTFL